MVGDRIGEYQIILHALFLERCSGALLLAVSHCHILRPALLDHAKSLAREQSKLSEDITIAQDLRMKLRTHISCLESRAR